MIIEKAFLIVRETDSGLTIPECVSLTRDRALLEVTRLVTAFKRANPDAEIVVANEVFTFPTAGIRFRIRPIRVVQ